ncbi:T9SS type A sorting domain-containing protein [Aurantibacillus circumpalustris]|uniref:T9SS type A sorting domain-containing protein n=1 Tax=Aurantibacillus circumpalustris TaxID=3036359 RepID=UPI00295B20E0|nr:T9SS type A sorting domain-containing protein [Aurantibacillus circumpalustris]
MKKITFFIIALCCSVNFAFSQATLIIEAPLDNTTTQVRAPNGTSTHAYLRACALVMQSELTNIPNATSISLFGFTLSTTGSVNIPVTGNFTVYLQNTTDVTYLKGTNWATIPTGMTTVYANIMTVPLSTTTSSIILTLSTPFVYTGGGIYVAYDWYSTGPYASGTTTNIGTYCADGGANLNPGCASGNSASSAPTTLGTTAFRPSFLFGFTNPYTNDIQVIGLEVPGKVNVSFNTPHSIKAIIRNSGSATQNNISVNLNVTGANTFVNPQTIPSLAAGTSSTVTFSAFNPQLIGANTISVSIPSDQNNTNNSSTYSQSVTCNQWAQNPATGNYTSNAVGFGTGSGIIATPYLNPVASNLIGIRGNVSNNATNAGNMVYAALLSSSGVIIATTNTVILTSATGFQTFTFTTPQALTANTTYYLGFAQMVPGNAIAYYPAGTEASPYLPANLYYSTALTGGVLNAITQNFGYFGMEAVFINNSNISATASSTAICTGGSATLSTAGVSTYTWNVPGPTSQSIVVSPATNTVYTVVGTNTLGCPVSTLISIQVTPLPVTAISNTSSVCLGTPVTFTAGGAISYTWATGGSPVNTAVFTDTPALTTTYVVTGSNNAGCTNTANVIVSVNTFTSMNVPTSASVCLGGTLYLTANGAVSYTWDTGTTTVNTFSLLSTPLATGVYTALGANALGCIDIKLVNVTVNSFTPGITSPTAICVGEQVTIAATGGAGTSYTWSTGFSGFSSLSNITPSVTTNYSVTVIGLNGCTGKNSTTITVNPNPTVTAVAQRSLMCKGETNTLTASGAATYSWSNGSNSTNTVVVITPSNTITYNYSVTGTSADGCVAGTQINVKVATCNGLAENTNLFAGIRVFPNPSNGIFIIHTNSTDSNAIIEVFSAIGSSIIKQAVTGSETILDLQNQANGVYFIKIQESAKIVYNSRIIKN